MTAAAPALATEHPCPGCLDLRRENVELCERIVALGKDNVALGEAVETLRVALAELQSETTRVHGMQRDLAEQALATFAEARASGLPAAALDVAEVALRGVAGMPLETAPPEMRVLQGGKTKRRPRPGSGGTRGGRRNKR